MMHLRVKIILFIDFETLKIICLATWQIKTSNAREINWFFITQVTKVRVCLRICCESQIKCLLGQSAN